MANQFPDKDTELINIPISWEVEISLDQKAAFTELLRALNIYIDPGNRLEKVRIIADDALSSTIQSLTGRPYQLGQYTPPGVAIGVKKENTFSSTILIRQAFFTSEPLQQISTLVEELYHCQLYHQAWQRRGDRDRQNADLYSNDLFVTCEKMHDEYAVARLKNTFFGEQFSFRNPQGQLVPFFIEYGETLSKFFDQAKDQIHTDTILRFAPSERKDIMLPFTYRFIFEPLARHAGFLTPIILQFPLRMPDNVPEANAFYREVIAPYWIPIKNALELSFDSQFCEIEAALRTITQTMDACLDRLQQEYEI